jgi:fumarate reductase subunit C
VTVARNLPSRCARPSLGGRWPARLDLAQSVSGLLLALFMWGHMLFVATILISKDAMWTVTKFFEGYFFFAEPQPWIVSVVVAACSRCSSLHAALALRKFPANYRQYALFNRHMRGLRHEDTTLWYWQVVTGFALFFLASAHLWWMLTHPADIGPYASADRVWSDHFWVLLPVCCSPSRSTAASACTGWSVKWGVFEGPDAARTRRRLRQAKWAITAFLLVLGIASLAAYVRIGIEYAPAYGERYVPTWAAGGGAP